MTQHLACNTNQAILQEGDACFQRFVSGQQVTADEITAMIEIAQGGSAYIDEIRFGYFRKALAWFTDHTGRKKFAKIAMHPFSSNSLVNEAQGIAAAGAIAGTLENDSTHFVHLPGDQAVLIRDRIDGTPQKRMAILSVPSSPFHYEERVEPATEYINKLVSGFDQTKIGTSLVALVEDILRGHPIDRLPVSRSHGDFVYWNTIRTKSEVITVDYESFSESRFVEYDFWYWHMLPISRLACRTGRIGFAANVLDALAPAIWKHRIVAFDPSLANLSADLRLSPRSGLALSALEHMAQMLGEHRMPDIIDLIGGDAYDLRSDLCKLYRRLIERLVKRT